ncbi:hypothetical protein [Bacillus sp. B-jedd]|uniref:hypothetical protein n=1 Tax=Bacillus sp. B-jedd TaxID=1476857 RepID=UPI000AE20D98|nr:hypothetical protein [Bacillus sp. B-jedd]
MNQQSILADVKQERDRQDSKWGLQRHDYGTWLTILVEEVGEVAQAMPKRKRVGRNHQMPMTYTKN